MNAKRSNLKYLIYSGKHFLKNLVYSGTSVLEDHDIRKRIVIGINKMCLFVFGINATIGVLSYLITQKNLILLGISIENTLAIIPVFLNKQLKFQSAALTFFFIISCATGYFSCILGKSVESQLMIIYLIGLSIFIFYKLIAQIISICYSVGMLIFVEYNFAHNLIKPIDVDAGTKFFMRCAVYGVVIFLVIITFSLYKRNIMLLLTRVQSYSNKIEANLQREEKKNKIKDRFISNASHEMKVSFHSIFAIINILYKVEQQAKTGYKLKQPIDDLRAACKISEGIIENIIEYERYEAGLNNTVNLQLIDLKIIVTNIIDIYKYLAEERRVEIQQSISEGIPQHILSDERIIRQIITNLLHNAIKFTRNGTNIIIRVQLEHQILILSVEDHGEGIAKESLDLIFEPFVTQNPDGLGLGLYIVKRLVTSLDGKIAVSQSSHAGTHFTLHIPLKESVWKDAEEIAI